MWTDLYPVAADELAEVLLTGPAVLSGLPGAGRAPLVREVVGERPIVDLRPRQAGTAAGLRIDTLNAIFRALASAAGGSTSRRDFNRLVADAFGARAEHALAIADRRDVPLLPMAEILEAVPGDAALLVHDAQVLAEPWAERTLWALRARAHAPDRAVMLLLTRPWHRGAVLGPDAAFFGFGQALDLPIPGFSEWVAFTGPNVPADELRWLLDQTRGLPRPTLAVLERALSADVAVHEAWRAHVRESERVAVTARRLVHGLHQYAPRLLTAIAAGDPVYRSVPEARTDAIAAALRAMRDHDVIYQPRRRKWVVADPALVPHLAAYG